MRAKPNTTNPKWLMNFQDLITALFRAHSARAAASVLGSYLILHLLPIAHFIAIGIVLVISDWFTGVWAAIKREEKITSRGLRRTVEKILMYSLAVFLVLMVETAFFGSSYVVAAVAMYIALVELFSNLENISSITGSNIIGIVRTTIYARFPFLKKLMNRERTDP
ncbi:MAG: phage holin family protein [Pseudomonadota bacterium]